MLYTQSNKPFRKRIQYFIRHYTYNLIITIQHAKVNESAHKILTNFSRYLTT